MEGDLVDLWANMGTFARAVVGVLLIMSVSTVFIAAERAIFFVRDRGASRSFASRIGAMLDRADFFAAAQSKDSVDIGHLGRVIRAGLSAFDSTQQDDIDDTIESVARALERQSQREVQGLRRGQGWLGTVAATAPFVGLMGTVVGIVNAFEAIAAAGTGGIGTVSAGIAEALVTTALGLLVAIPAVVAFNLQQSWVEARTVDLSESANEFLDRVALTLRRAHRKQKESAVNAKREAEDAPLASNHDGADEGG